MKKPFFIVLFTSFSVVLAAQEQPQKPKIDVKPYGFVSYEAIFDTYKLLDARDGELIFYPLKPKIAPNGTDVNRKNQFQMLSIITRLGLSVSGPDILGAKSTAKVETDFYATANAYTYLLRLRHAFISLKWQNAQLLMGNYWHPVIVDEVIPSAISFGGGVPFHSLNRSPQIRLSIYPIANLKVTLAALSQGYHKTKGPEDAQRNSGLPEIFGQVAYGNAKSFVVGASSGYKWLTPRLSVPSTGTGTHKTIGQYLFSGFAKATIDQTVIKAEIVYGENPTHLNMIGGYGRVTETDVNGDYDYANLRTLSTWLDADHQVGKWGFGVFAGYSKLYGSNKNYSSIADYNRNDDLNYIYRISPRVTYKEENLTLALEYMVTTAVYGQTFDNKRRVTSSLDPVSNHRVTFSAKYSF